MGATISARRYIQGSLGVAGRAPLDKEAFLLLSWVKSCLLPWLCWHETCQVPGKHSGRARRAGLELCQSVPPSRMAGQDGAMCSGGQRGSRYSPPYPPHSPSPSYLYLPSPLSSLLPFPHLPSILSLTSPPLPSSSLFFLFLLSHARQSSGLTTSSVIRDL